MLHHARIADSAMQPIPGPAVISIDVLTDPAFDTANISIAEIMVEVPVRLPIPEDCVGVLDDFLRVRATFDLPGGRARAGYRGRGHRGRCAGPRGPHPALMARGLLRKLGAQGWLSLTALMEPPMFGFMEPLTGADLGSRTG